MEHAPHFNGVTDATTLFLLSADATPEDVQAGQALSWAKAELPHGEYLPWVQQACGLKPQYASKLIKAAEWANVAHVQHLDGITDAATPDPRRAAPMPPPVDRPRHHRPGPNSSAAAPSADSADASDRAHHTVARLR